MEESMNPARSSSHSKSARRSLRIMSNLLAAAALILTTTCGGGAGMGGTSPSRPVLTGNTLVTVVLSSIANDQLTEFDLGIQSLILTDKSGKTVSLVSALQSTEFIHVNGGLEPLITVSIPQDIYTSATATIGGAQFSCITLTPQGGLSSDTYAYGQTPSANVTVNVPAPITVTGNSMALSLNLLVAQSAEYGTCYSNGGIPTYSITPTFNLTPADFSFQPTNPANGKALGFNGQVSAVNTTGGSFTLALPEVENPRTISVSSASTTAYQGVNNFSDLTVGTFVNLDGAIQPDGSLLATRIAVEDNTATSVVTGPLVFVSDAEPALFMWGRQQQGALYNDQFVLGSQAFSFTSAIFQISSQLSNVQDLPFTPSFTAANIVPGQNVYLSASTLQDSGGFPYTPLSTVTLIPQSLDGTVAGSSSVGNFTVYTIELASYDLFPALAVQQGQASLLNNPSEVQVYVDTSTQQLNSQPLASGGTFRFYGLVFNDNGTLRMDCAQVNDGVSVTPPAPSSMDRMVSGQAKIVRTGNLGQAHQISRLITPSP
jgi:hypothetical protein